ncbi:MAG: hypothetical protein R2795_27585, partial [Saprospiraceae bacterium]
AVVLAVIALVGYAAALLGYPNEAIRTYHSYPYLGTVYRTAGLTGGPGMLVSVLLLPSLYAWVNWRRGTQSFVPLAILLAAIFLSFSKQ